MDGRLSRGRVPVVVVTPPPGADPTSAPPAPRGISASFIATGSEIEGRISLTMLAALVVGAVMFYWWTRTAQGGG